MAASVKIEFDDGSRVISQTLEDAAGVADAGGNAVVLGDKRPASCPMDDYYEITKTTAFIADGNFERVALQFPDPLLREAPEVVWTLQARVRQLQTEMGKGREGGEGGEGSAGGEGEGRGRRKEPLIFVTGDTSYGSCCVDEVSAQHLKADAIVHYGRACLSPTNSSVPVLYVFGRGHLDVKDLASALLSGPLSPGPHAPSRNASQVEAAAGAAAAAAAAAAAEAVAVTVETGPPPLPPVLLLYDVTYAHAVRGLLELLGDDVTRDGRLVVGFPTPQAYSPLGRNRPSGESGEAGGGCGCGADSALPQQQKPQQQQQQQQQQLQQGVALSGEGTADAVEGRGQTSGCRSGVGSAGCGVVAGGRGCCSRESGSGSESARGGAGQQQQQPSRSGAACAAAADGGGACGRSASSSSGGGGEEAREGVSTAATEMSGATASVGSETPLGDDDASAARKPCSVGEHALGGGSEKVRRNEAASAPAVAAAAVAAGGSGESTVGAGLPVPVGAKRRVRIGGLDVELDSEEALKRHALVFVGGEGRQLSNILLRCAGCVDRVRYDPSLPAGQRVVQDTGKGNKDLMRRYYLVQRAKEAEVIGIVVGTLGVQRYSSVVRSLRRMIEDAGRKAYTLAVGKVNVAKLANFAEVDVFCLVACAENSLLNSREFHAPVVTPLELEVALGKREWDGFYSTDFDDVLALHGTRAPPATDPEAGTGTSTTSYDTGVAANGAAMGTLSLGRVNEDETAAAEEDETVDDDEPFFSLVTGTYKNNPGVSRRKGGIGGTGDAGGAAVGGAGGGALAAIGDRSLVEWSSPAADFLGKREFKGLEAMVGQTEVKAATEGQSGIASDYGGV